MKLLELQKDPAKFRDALLIDTDAGPMSFKDCIDPWQADDFKALDSGWKRAVVGAKAEAEYQRGWLERPRGHSKSLDLGIMALWALFASRRRLSGIAAAADLDQARLLRDAIGKLVYINEWLQPIIEVQNYKVVNVKTESCLDVISSDAPSAFGLTPDFLCLDEVVHWKKRDLWDSLISSAAKRSSCMVTIITNAGITGEWQFEVREKIRQDPSWFFSRLDKPVADWISDELLREQERLLPPAAYKRLWLNIWSTQKSDWISDEVLAAAFDNELQPQTAAVPGFEYTAGLDLGVSRNWSALVVLGVVRGRAQHGLIQLATVRIWKPTPGKKVNLQDVEDEIRRLHDTFDFRQLSIDPWNAAHMMSRLQSGGLGTTVRGQSSWATSNTGLPYRRPTLPLAEVIPSGQSLQRQATVLIEAFNDRRIRLYPHFDLKRQLQRLHIEERPYGFRLSSPVDADGSHGDVASAFALAMLAATELAAKKVITAGCIGADGCVGDDDTPVGLMPGDPRSRTEQLRRLNAFAPCYRDVRFEQERAEYTEEQILFSQREDSQAPFREWMRKNTDRIL